MTTEDKQRIGDEAELFSQTVTNGSRMQYEIIAHKRGFIAGAEYANKQLEEKEKEIEEVIKHNNLLTQNGGLLNELKDKDLEIARLKEALRKAAIQLKCDKALIMLWVEPEAPREYEVKNINKLEEEIEQLLK